MILIDDRLGSKDLISTPPLSNNPSIAQLCRLDSADAAFYSHDNSFIGVELKHIHELLSSISNGRLAATQIPAMRKEYTHSWLLIYGLYRPCPQTSTLQTHTHGRWQDYNPGRKNPIPFSYLQSFLLTLTYSSIHIHHCANLRESAYFIYTLFKWHQKPTHTSLHTFDNSRTINAMPNYPEVILRCAEVAAKLPGLGYKRAIRAALHFDGCIEDMIGAGVDEWSKIEGVGKGIAQSVVEAVRQKYKKPRSASSKNSDKHKPKKGRN